PTNRKPWKSPRRSTNRWRRNWFRRCSKLFNNRYHKLFRTRVDRRGTSRRRSRRSSWRRSPRPSRKKQKRCNNSRLKIEPRRRRKSSDDIPVRKQPRPVSARILHTKGETMMLKKPLTVGLFIGLAVCAGVVSGTRAAQTTGEAIAIDNDDLAGTVTGPSG